MAIGHDGKPYIHSNYSNFFYQITGQGITSKGATQTDTKIAAKIAELENIKNVLKNATDAFRQGKTDQQIYNEIFGAKNSFQRIALEVLRSVQYYKDVEQLCGQIQINENLKKQLGDMLIQEKEDIVTKKELSDSISKWITANIINNNSQINLTFGDKKRVQQQSIASLMEKKLGINKESVDTLINEVLGENSRNFEKRYINKLKKSSNKIAQLYINQINSTSFSERLYKAFEIHFRQKANQIPTIKEQTNAVDTYLKEFKAALSKMTKNMDFATLQNLYGFGGEQMASIAINKGGGNIEIKLIGQKSTKKATTKIINDIPEYIRYSLRHDTTQSYSDFIMVHKGKEARCQVKNYIGQLNAILKNKQEKNNPSSELMAQIGLYDGESLDKFLERLSKVEESATYLTYEQKEELIYGMANEAWFRYAGSINKGQVEDETVKPIKVEQIYHQTVINMLLSDVMLNYLGIMVDKNFAVHTNISNLYFLINTNRLIPTYKVIEHLILTLKQWEVKASELKSNRLKTNVVGRISMSSPPTKDARSFLIEKRNAVKKFEGSSYTDPALLKVGTDMGEAIVKKLKVQSINLNVNLSNIYTTSYIY